jgi:hypothetical protein
MQLPRLHDPGLPFRASSIEGSAFRSNRTIDRTRSGGLRPPTRAGHRERWAPRVSASFPSSKPYPRALVLRLT